MTNISKLKNKRKHKPVQSVIPDMYQIPITRSVSPTSYSRWKNIPDRIFAAVLLIPSLPIIFVLMVLVRITSHGPGIYPQCRMGINGRKFNIYKIRTMIHNAEGRTGPAWTQVHDPRITKLGRIMRKFHLDEFPQLFNVLKGEMSLVGPRPERPEFVEVLVKQIPNYTNRMVVRPGITGLAQLNLPPDSDINSVRSKLSLDLEYIEQAGLFMDIRLLICTALRIFKIPALELLKLKRKVVLLPIPSGNGNNTANQNVVTPANITPSANFHSAQITPAGRDGKRPLPNIAKFHTPNKPK